MVGVSGEKPEMSWPSVPLVSGPVKRARNDDEYEDELVATVEVWMTNHKKDDGTHCVGCVVCLGDGPEDAPFLRLAQRFHAKARELQQHEKDLKCAREREEQREQVGRQAVLRVESEIDHQEQGRDRESKRLQMFHEAEVQRVTTEFERKLAELKESRERALQALEMKAMRGAGGSAALYASVLKVLGTEAMQRIDVLACDIEGQAAWAVPNGQTPADLAVAAPRYLNDRAASIYAGSNEIQRDLIAKLMFA